MRNKRGIAAVVAALVLAASGTAFAVRSWSRWFSEEGDNIGWCPQGSGGSGYACRGSYCDTQALGCWTVSGGIDTSQAYWSPWFSEEGATDVYEHRCITHPDGSHYCEDLLVGTNFRYCYGGFPANNKGIVTGVQCSGRYCDNKRLHCVKPAKGTLKDCYWSGYISEEIEDHFYGDDEFVTGMECTGRYCDNVRLYICKLVQ
jgi:hypothetical protein